MRFAAAERYVMEAETECKQALMNNANQASF